MLPRIALLALAILIPWHLAGEPLPDPFEEEDPATLLDFTILDADVSFLAIGSWTTGIAPGVGWVVSRLPSGARRASPGYLFPGLEPVSYFNRPAMTLSLWLLERYFFETTITEDISESTILFGYEGREGESVRSVLIGNTAIGIGSYPYLGFGETEPDGGRNAPGVSAAFETPWSEHEFMVRFAPAEEAEIRYAGGGIVSESRIPAIDYERNRHFVLPDGSLDFLSVYVEVPDGGRPGSDGRRYRPVDLQRETSFSLSDGTLSFDAEVKTRVVVYYESGGLPIGDPGLGTGAYFGLDPDGTPKPDDRRDFSFATITEYAALFDPDAPPDAPEDEFIVTIDGRQGFLLHQPGRYAPFAYASVYRVENDATTIGLETPAGRPVGSTLRFIRSATRDRLTLQGADPDPRAWENRYPLGSDRVENPVRALYGPAPSAPPQTPELVLRSVSPTTRIVLAGGHVRGSVRVTRNGTTETAFTVRSDGEIVFDRPLEPTDVVLVRYRTTSGAEAGDLLFAIGNRFSLAPGSSADLALGGRWKPPQQDFSTRPGEYPGHLILSGALRTDSDEWRSAASRAGDGSGGEVRGELRGELRGALSFSSADTSGALRVAGMDEAGRTIPIVATSLFAAPVPTVNPGLGPQPLLPTGRGRLYYRDLYETNLIGGRTLLPYDLEPLPPRLPYDEGGRTGPYPALATDAGYTGTVAVLEYEMDEAHSWVAGLLRIDGGRGTDLSGVRMLIVPYRVLEASGTSELHLQIGAIGEDLDGDGVVDQGTNGLPFRDEAAGATLLTGAIPPAGHTYTEDATASGVLEAELPDMILSAGVDAATAGWQVARIEITAAEARRLQSARAIRFLFTSDEGQAAAGRVLVGEIEALGSAFAVSYPADTATVYVHERRHDDPAYADARFSDAFPEVASRFASPGVDPHLLSIRWSGLEPEDEITVSRAAAVPAADYGSMRLYYRPADTTAVWPPSATLTLRARSDVATIAEGTVPLEAAGWRELTVRLPAESASIITAIDVVVRGAAEGEVLVDELSMWDPRTSLGAVAALEIELRPGFTLTINDRTVVSDLSLEQRLSVQSASFPDEVGSTRTGVESSTDLGARILGASAGIGLDLLANRAGSGAQIRHEMRIPIAPLGLVVSDTFRSAYGAFEPTLSHAAGVEIGVRGIGLSWDWRRTLDEDDRNEWITAVDYDLRPQESGGPGLSLGATARIAQTVAGAEPPAPYPRAWAQSYRHVLPAESPHRREGSTRLTGALEAGITGVELHAAGGFRADSFTVRRTVNLEYGVGIPLRLAIGELALRLSREAVLVDAASPEPSPLDDLRSAALLTGEHPILYSLWPVAELFSREYPSETARLTDGLLEARYRPEAGVEYRRRIRSSPWSLIAPSSARLSVARPARRAADAASSIYEAGLDTLAVAPNLFGRLGSHPTVDFYDTDEFQTGLRVTVRGGDGAPWTSRIGVDQTVRLAWIDGRSLRLENVFSTSVPSEHTMSLSSRVTWKRRLAAAVVLPIPLPERLQGIEPAVELETTAEIDYQQGPTSLLIWRLERARTYLFANSGSVRLHGGFGVGTRQTAAERELLLGLRAGIEGRIQL